MRLIKKQQKRERVTALLPAVSIRMRLLGVVVSFGLVMGVAACGSLGNAIPDDATTATDQALTVVVPDDWSEGGDTSDMWPTSWQDGETEEESDYKLVLNGDYGDRKPDTANGVFMAEAQIGGIPGFKHEESIEEERDNLSIYRMEYTYGEEDDRYNGVVWTVQNTDTDQTVAMQITGEVLDEELIDDLESSIAISSGDTA